MGSIKRRFAYTGRRLDLWFRNSNLTRNKEIIGENFDNTNKIKYSRQVGVEPTTFCLGNRRSIHWATGADISHFSFYILYLFALHLKCALVWWSLWTTINKTNVYIGLVVTRDPWSEIRPPKGILFLPSTPPKLCTRYRERWTKPQVYVVKH